MDDTRHILGAAHDVLRVFPVEKLSDRLAEKFQPTFEQRPLKDCVREQTGVAGDGIPPESPGTEHHGIPEVTDLGQMRLPVHLCDTIEHMPERLVRTDFGIKRIDEPDDIRTAREVPFLW